MMCLSSVIYGQGVSTFIVNQRTINTSAPNELDDIAPQAVQSLNAGNSVIIYFDVQPDANGNSLVQLTNQITIWPYHPSSNVSLTMTNQAGNNSPQGIQFAGNLADQSFTSGLYIYSSGTNLSVNLSNLTFKDFAQGPNSIVREALQIFWTNAGINISSCNFINNGTGFNPQNCANIAISGCSFTDNSEGFYSYACKNVNLNTSAFINNFYAAHFHVGNEAQNASYMYFNNNTVTKNASTNFPYGQGITMMADQYSGNYSSIDFQVLNNSFTNTGLGVITNWTPPSSPPFNVTISNNIISNQTLGGGGIGLDRPLPNWIIDNNQATNLGTFVSCNTIDGNGNMPCQDCGINFINTNNVLGLPSKNNSNTLSNVNTSFNFTYSNFGQGAQVLNLNLPGNVIHTQGDYSDIRQNYITAFPPIKTQNTGNKGILPPAVSSFIIGGNGLVISFSLPGQSGAYADYVVDFYKSNPQGYLLDYIGSATVNVLAANYNYNIAVPAGITLQQGDRIAATVSSMGNSGGTIAGTSEASYVTAQQTCCNHQLALTYTSGVNCGSDVYQPDYLLSTICTTNLSIPVILPGNPISTCVMENINVGIYQGTACSCPSGLQYSWDFGDGYTTSGINVSHAYTTGGTYTITVVASSGNGSACVPETFTTSVNVLSNCCTQQFSLNAFSTHSKTGPYCAGDGLKFNVNYQRCTIDPHTASILWTFSDGYSATTGSVTHAFASPGTYTINASITNPLCSSAPGQYSMTVQIIDCPETVPCSECIGSFAPPPGDYIVSLWVKEEQAAYVENYASGVSITCTDGNNQAVSPAMYYDGTSIPVYKIIDGWQKIEQKFTIPSGTAYLQISLNNNSGVDAYFDDIRIHPFNSSLKSYVYDPVTLRLMAELDENNYATFYEYDEDGALIRVKKETERGIKTIKEARNNVKK